MGSKSQQYLSNVANHVCVQIGGVDTAFMATIAYDFLFERKFWKKYGGQVLEHLKKFGPEALGRIVGAAPFGANARQRINYFGMNQGEDLNTPKDAREVLLLLAAYVVTAQMCEIAMSSLRQREALAEELEDVRHM